MRSSRRLLGVSPGTQQEPMDGSNLGAPDARSETAECGCKCPVAVEVNYCQSPDTARLHKHFRGQLKLLSTAQPGYRA
jgi:hypothetical protein